MQKGIVVRCLEVHQCVCDRKGEHGIEDQFHGSVLRQVPAASSYAEFANGPRPCEKAS